MDSQTEKTVRATFGSRSDDALGLLSTYGTDPWHNERDRVRRAILTLAGDDLDKLRHFVDVARRDYRDVLYWAEYPPDPSDPKTYEELRERLRLPPEE